MRLLRLVVLPFQLAILLVGGTASAQVEIGNNVFVGGHRVTPGTYRSVHIETTTRRPPWYGCRWFAPGAVYQGRRIRTRTKICNWRQVPYNKK
ncbi:hypothetical protein GCM10007874_48570 [Labrys miyagiensis]|uniref:Secreted protein n=1 Tax=Labrys miyagiensis TaxID=346912 RepID=A0ABQ6CPU5_9HYPH|nr:hypothetical protein [Labrys miyagiensis]GLS21840.1 hypothetical protein GCM10007874_48570 [Labrys miyagiensis]